MGEEPRAQPGNSGQIFNGRQVEGPTAGEGSTVCEDPPARPATGQELDGNNPEQQRVSSGQEATTATQECLRGPDSAVDGNFAIACVNYLQTIVLSRDEIICQ
jgi:hypothetical protein